MRGDEAHPGDNTFVTTSTLPSKLVPLAQRCVVSAQVSENSQIRVRSVLQEGELKSVSIEDLFELNIRGEQLSV